MFQGSLTKNDLIHHGQGHPNLFKSKTKITLNLFLQITTYITNNEFKR